MMKRATFKHRLARYRSKLKYELNPGGEKWDSVLFRKLLRESRNLKYRRWSNKNFIYINPLGVKSFLR
nr:MAG TPA: hypothetical protein [Caudoviricetes sp.]